MSTRLELTWIGKDVRPKLEPRILMEDTAKSYHASHRVSDADIFGNRLIHGDNLLALKALELEFAGKVKCIYIDPPYNTGSAFEHYDDGVEHSIWLSLMRDRLEILHKLLQNDGTIWISIDQNEGHYLKVLCDEIFGRHCFIADICWRSADSSNNDSTQFSIDHNSTLVYAKMAGWTSNKLERTEVNNAHYSNPDDDPKGPWFSGNLQSPNPRQNLMFTIISPSGHEIKHPKNGWRWSQERIEEMISDGEIVFTNNDTKILRKTYLCNQKGLAPSSIWFDVEETGHNRQAKYELKKIFPGIATSALFKTPKPERLIQRILHIATNPGDLVLDSFLGSGTTAAVAHKMGRRWIGIELGEHCTTHCLPRLKKVVDGEDPGGITTAVNWEGGGGFRFYELGPSLIKQDKWGNPVINPQFNPEMLAQAVCKLAGFTYAPDPETFWMHGKGSEADFIYVTTQHLDAATLAALNDEVGPERSLLVFCYAFDDVPLPQITVKKIPQTVLDMCDWDHDDYSLEISNLPAAQAEAGTVEPKAAPAPKKRGKKLSGQGSLFDTFAGTTDSEEQA